ncbi:MAG: hypothetical protein GY771_04805, partial [bacterium]|nr:hypothetical protein [bacterium]
MNIPHATIIISLLLSTFSAFAAYEVPGIPLEISGELNSHYRMSFVEQQKIKGYYHIIETETKYYNEFDLNDVYLGFKFDVTEDISANLTLMNSSSYIYHAYVDVGGIIPKHTIRVGRIETPWVAFEEDIWGWRSVERTAINREGFLHRTDLGVAVNGEFFDGLIQHDISFGNGDGDELGSERGKDIQWRISAYPFSNSDSLKGFSINALGHYGNIFADKRLFSDSYPVYYEIYLEPMMYYVFGGLIGFQHTYIDAGAGYFKRIMGTDISDIPEETQWRYDDIAETRSHCVTTYATYHALSWLDVFGRYDYVDPDIQRPDDPRSPPENRDDRKAAYEIADVGCGFQP